MDIIRDSDAPERGPVGTGTSRFGGPQPSQDFVFPFSSVVGSPAISHQRMASNTEHVPSRGTTHRAKPSNLSISALPPFEFGGSSTNDPTATLIPSPSRSPARLTPPLPHSSGHRRGGSEFIGGDIVHGGGVFLSASPTAGEDVAHAPPSPPKGPPTGRRGHAHRRSGAVSQSDIKAIMQPSNMPKAGSAPSTPSNPLFQPPLHSDPGTSVPLPDLNTVVRNRTPPPTQRLHSAPSQSRSRVGFSDHIEYIPRPLSTISSETSSSMSTIRANHSVTNSISSIVSGITSNLPVPKDSPPEEVFDTNENVGARDAAGPVYSTFAEDNRALESVPIRSPEDTTASSECTNRMHHKAPSGLSELSFQGGSSDPSPAITSETERATLCDLSGEAINPPSSRPRPTLLAGSQCARPRTSPDLRAARSQQKVKSWAGSILHWKGKHEQESMEAMPRRVPPIPQGCPTDSDFFLDNVTFDDDTTCILEEPSAHATAPSTLQSTSPSQRNRILNFAPEHETTNSMIDLDAALGSLGSPSHEPAYDDYIGSFGTGKRRLHSSGETGGFMGRGMHYHRRAESAPEMEPFDRTCYGFPRLGSNPAMNEAIEEEEEDVEQDIRRWDQQVPGLGINVVDSERACDEPIKRRRGTQPARDIHRASTPPTTETMVPVDVVGAQEEPRFSVLTKSSDESTITPKLSCDPLAPRPASAPIDFALPTPSLASDRTPETTSAVSSADYSKSSFDCHDIPRFHTANSSITDRTTLNSSKAGGHSASSVDDVPSLSHSTSTTFSGHPNRFSSSGNTMSSAERSASLSEAAPVRARLGSSSKRASLASLTKLMGGSYNKSKLNIAETLQPDSPEKPDKKKRRRISRLMTFWKSKERLSAG
ncbi:MAG: hypothetical protein Q9164_000880 [Protoblastenia rupestris]